MPRMKVVPRIRVGRLTLMAFVLGLALGLLVMRVPAFVSPPGGSRVITLALSLGVVPVGLLLPFFDQRFRKLARYVAAGAAACVLAVLMQVSFRVPSLKLLPVVAVAYSVRLWLVGLAAAGLGLLAGRACYSLVIQDGTLCPGCGYKLVGLTSQVCPECGREFTYKELGTTRECLQAAARKIEEDEDTG